MLSVLPRLAPVEPPPPAAEAPPSDLALVKRLIWLYFWLLIFEGALRKWFLPGWSNPLLLVRDPVVILIYIFAVAARVFPRNGFITWITGLGVVTFLVSELCGHGNLLVSLYGFRTSFLHLPLIFVVPNVFTKDDLDRMAKWFLITSIPMCLIVIAQFRGSPGDWINNGAGGAQGGQLEVGFGKIRPPGTFSFTAVLVSYLSVVAAFAIHSQMQKNHRNFKVSLFALPALAIMVGISGSRSALGAVTIILISVVVICLRQSAFFGRGIKTIVILGTAYFVLNSWSEFRQGVEIHHARIEGGGGLKDGIVMRALGDLLEPFSAMFDTPFFGTGLGMGTNAASGFLYGRVVFNLGEGDWGRIVRESGPLLGFLYIGLRIAILIHLSRRSLESLNRNNDPLPMLLLAAAFPQVLNGQFGVPSLLGFAVFNAGLCLAATADPEPVLAPAPAQQPEMATVTTARSFRGRSVYSEQLHGEAEDPAVARFGP